MRQGRSRLAEQRLHQRSGDLPPSEAPAEPECTATTDGLKVTDRSLSDIQTLAQAVKVVRGVTVSAGEIHIMVRSQRIAAMLRLRLDRAARLMFS